MSPKPSKRWSWRLCVVAVFLCALSGVAGCRGKVSSLADADNEVDVEAFCKTQRHQFHEAAWAPLFVKNCQGCHNTSGFAQLELKSRFVLLPETYPNAAQANLELITSMAKEKVKGTSYLLAKASNEIQHVGGSIFEKGSKEYAQLQNFIAELENKDASMPSCSHVAVRMDSRLSKVQPLEPRAVFRKAALNIAGRLPTEEEDARLLHSPGQLDALMDALLEEEAFYERLKEIFNDTFLARGQTWFDRFNFLVDTDNNIEDYPDLVAKLNSASQLTSESQKSLFLNRVHISLWEEPLALIAHVARNNRPFTEILTAHYAVVNPYSAYVYGLESDAPSLQAPVNAWRTANLWQRRNTSTAALVPSSGVLSTASFLSRHRTTYLNASRGRAEFISRNFLATSILSFAQRPINSAQLDGDNKAAIFTPACSVCHYHMDGIAATFTGFSFWQQASYQPHRTEWRDKKFLPSFQGEEFPSPRTNDNTQAMPWMAQRIAADARFPYAMVLKVFEGVTGRKPLAYSRDTAHPQYAELLSAWESQNAFLHEVAATMAQEGMNIKVAFREILKSPYFQAAQDANLPAELAIGLGEGRLLTPEMLSRKISATLGAHWGRFRHAEPFNFLSDNNYYNVLYGGIHPTQNPSRVTQINTMMAAAAGTMALEMACRLPAWELNKRPAERVVLTKVEKETTPFLKYADGLEANPEGERAIRENLAYLHQRLLGEFVSPHSPEVDLSYALFADAWKERAESNNTHINCDRMLDLSKAADDNPYGSGYAALPHQEILRDNHFTLYAWQAVLTYLLMDFRFIHE